MYELQWLIIAGAGGVLLGVLLGLGLGRTLFRGRKTRDMESELETAQESLRSYRAEVYDQFAETARKFDKLNESYNDLHRHLASSASALLGDGISTPLLAGPAPVASTRSTHTPDAPPAGMPLRESIPEAAEPESAAEHSTDAEPPTLNEQHVRGSAAAADEPGPEPRPELSPEPQTELSPEPQTEPTPAKAAGS